MARDPYKVESNLFRRVRMDWDKKEETLGPGVRVENLDNRVWSNLTPAQAKRLGERLIREANKVMGKPNRIVREGQS